jgi:hypothetical protein
MVKGAVSNGMLKQLDDILLHGTGDLVQIAVKSTGKAAKFLTQTVKNTFRGKDKPKNPTPIPGTSPTYSTPHEKALAEGPADGWTDCKFRMPSKAEVASIIAKHWASEMAKITEVVTALHHHRFPVNMVPSDTQDEMLRDIAAKAAEKGYLILPSERSHLLQMETSFWTVEPGVIHMAVHIPIHKEQELYRIFAYVPLPVTAGKASLVHFAPEHEIISIKPQDGYFRSMTTADLATCDKFGNHYTCVEGNIRFDNTEENIATLLPAARCILFLYKQLIPEADEVCPKTITEHVNHLIQISPTQFVAYLIKQVQATVTCPLPTTDPNYNAKGIKTEEKKQTFYEGRTDFEIGAGCWVDFPLTMRATSIEQIEGLLELAKIQWRSTEEVRLRGLDVARHETARSTALVPYTTDLNTAIAIQTEDDRHWQFTMTAIGQGFGLLVVLSGMIASGLKMAANVRTINGNLKALKGPQDAVKGPQDAELGQGNGQAEHNRNQADAELGQGNGPAAHNRNQAAPGQVYPFML